MSLEPSTEGSSNAARTPLDRVARRILGVLIEKALTTPEGYPLTANSVVVGANQKSNRDPVVNYSTDMIDEGLMRLRDAGLVDVIETATGRTLRYKHRVKEAWGLDRPARSVLAELMLRGPQTEGEIRGRASRMAPLASLEEARNVLEHLASRGFARKLTSGDRKRGVVWAHQLYQPSEEAELGAAASDEGGAASPSTPRDTGVDDRIGQLEAAIASLQEALSQANSRLSEISDAQAQMADAIASLKGAPSATDA